MPSTHLPRPALVAILGRIQNTPRFAHVDIMTFSGFMSAGEELTAYVQGQFAQLPVTDQVKVIEATRAILSREVA